VRSIEIRLGWVPMRATGEPRARPVRIAISRLPIIPLAPASHEGIATNEAARLHPISIWLHNQIVSRMVIGVP
jgi:hypothetical protein